MPTASPVHRIVRARRTMRRAAEILEREATCLRDSHTVCGDWDHPDAGPMTEADKTARQDHDEMIAIARQLRMIGGRS